ETAYYRAARMMAELGAPRRQVADAMLRATWEAPGASYHRYVTELLELLVPTVAEIADEEERLPLQRLQGELLRRIGRFDSAREHFARLAQVAEPETFDGLVIAFELELIAAGDSRPKMTPPELYRRATLSTAAIRKREPMRPTGGAVIERLLR